MSTKEFDKIQKELRTAYIRNTPNLKNDDIVDDGYVLADEWDTLIKTNSPKICFLMKEPTKNVDFKNIMKCNNYEEINNWIKDTVLKDNCTFYRRSILFSKVIFDSIEKKEVDRYKIRSYKKEELTDTFKKIACINVKKTKGDTSSDMKEIKKYAIKYKDLLKKEIKALDPDILILGYTSEAFLELYPSDNKNWYLENEDLTVSKLNDDNGPWWFDFLTKGFDGKSEPKLIINYYHFSARGADELLYLLGLNKIINEAKKYLKKKDPFPNSRLYKVLQI